MTHNVLRPLPHPANTVRVVRRALAIPGRGGGGSGTIADGFGLVKLGTQNLTEVKNQTILSLVLNREKENIQNVRTDKAAGITLLPFSFSWFIVSSAQICTFSGR